MIERISDEGMQAERTLLAWQRTCLGLIVASILAMRFLAPDMGPTAAAIGLTGGALVAVAWIAVFARYRQTNRALDTSARLSQGGAPLAALAAATLLIATGGLGFVMNAARG